MKMYVFTHRWLSQTQRGIQMSHVIAEMVMKSFSYNEEARKPIEKWVNVEKTIISLDGGSSRNLEDICVILKAFVKPKYIHSFNEDIDSLNGATTCVACLVSEETLYDMNFLQLKDYLNTFSLSI